MKSTMKILIDNGHGKNTPGKRSPYSSHQVLPAYDFYEWEFNRSIARTLVQMLRSHGYDAEQLVTEERDITLMERVTRANRWCDKLGADNVLLISIHADASGDGSAWNAANGWSAYTTKGHTKSDVLAECLYKSAERHLDGRKIRRDRSDGDSDWEQDFYILKHSKCPAVLTENLFYTNVEDVKFQRSKEGQKAIVETHFDGIVGYLQSIGKK